MFAADELTFTGGLITDAVRAAGVEGDGLTPPAGVGIWPGATNLVTQSIPGATAGTGVTLAGAAEATLTKGADAAAPFQASSTDVWLLDNSAGATDATVDFAGNATAAAHTGSAWARAIVGSPTVSIEGGGTPTVIAVSAAYARYSQSRTATAGDNLRITAPAGAVVRFTAGQLETGSIATPFIVTDGGTASRVDGRVQQTTAGLFTSTQGWVYARLKYPQASTGMPAAAEAYVFSWRTDNNNRIGFSYFGGSQRWQATKLASGAGTGLNSNATFAANTGASTLLAWTATHLRFSADGAAFTQVANTSAPTVPASVDIGNFANLAQMDGNVLWYVTGSGVVTDADSAALNAFGDTPPTPAALKSSLSMQAQPTSLWQAVDNTFTRIL